MAKRSSLFIAALSSELAVSNGQPPQEFRLFPAGRFHSVDGRPDLPADGWLMNAQVAARLIAAAKARRSDYVIDYEHQTLHAAKNGQRAPAAAWFHDLQWREGDGLYVVAPRWTAAAASHVADHEYRYVSPVFSWDKTTGEVTAILHAALVNDPGLDGLTDFSALGAHFADFSEEEPMDLLTKLFIAAGLPAPKDEAAATAALSNLTAEAAKVKPLETEVTALKAKLTPLETEVAALKANTGNPDPAKFVPIATMTEMQTQIAALSAQINGGEVDGLVKSAIDEGKLLPAQEAWARDLGKKDVAALKSFLATAPANAALAGGTQTGGKDPVKTPGKLSDVELAVCKSTGISTEEFLKTRDAAAA